MKCPYCKRELVKVFHGEPDDELAEESLTNSIIIGNCCESSYNYYCEYCDEFFRL
ncbi:MAG: hypothetical protein J6P09_02770 [Methanobrevibacter sp.]|nr:hypothetical protein [Methanobrevibacter sp.]